MASISTDVAIAGTGTAGIATAYYLARNHGIRDIVLIDRDQPMAFTSAQSGENYRNWWPQPQMVAFMDRSIDLLEDVARESGNVINMSRRGYLLATRESTIDELLAQLRQGLGGDADRLLRFHDSSLSRAYEPAKLRDWEAAPDGVDIISDESLIRRHFPFLDQDVRTLVHIRRGGDISGQQLGMYMLDYLKQCGARRVVGTIEGIETAQGYCIELSSGDVSQVEARRLVNAAGPFAGDIAKMLDVELPLHNTFQQKIAFDDRLGAVPRTMPFAVDLDEQEINWSAEERDMLLDEPEFRWLVETMPGAIHCRPDGGDRGTWIKLGWAFNEKPATVQWEPPLDDNFPDIVLRGASRLNPALGAYIGRLPRGMHHYGGWYTMTEENWPLIGPMGPEGSFMACALSGFGTMAACAAGELCATWIADRALPHYASGFALQRFSDHALMATLRNANKGLL